MKLSRIRQRLFGGEAGGVFRGMATLAMGTGMARLIGIASIPLLTRLYSPEDYGVLSVYTALVIILAPMLTLRYVLAVPLPRSDAMAMNLMALSALLMTGTTVLLVVLLWAFGPTVLGWMSMDVLAPWWWLVVLGAVATALYEGLSMWATRRRVYRIIAKTQVFQSALGEGLKLLLGLLAFKPFGLLLGQLMSQGGGTGSFLLHFRKDFRLSAAKIGLKHMKLIAQYYRGYPIYRLPSQFLLVFSIQAPVIFAAALYSAETTGQLGLALMALALPLNLIGQSVGSAFYAEIARLQKGSSAKIKKISYSVQKRLFLVGIPVAATLLFLGEDIFQLVFGEQWREAGVYASILSPYVLLQLTSAPLMQVLNIYNLQGCFLVINIIRTTGIIAIYIASDLGGVEPIRFVSLLSGFLFSFYLIVSIFILFMVRKEALPQNTIKNKAGNS